MRTLLLSIFLLLNLNAFGQENFNLELLAHVDFGGEAGNDIWGYVAPDGTEYAIVGAARHTYIYDLSDPTDPIEVASIPGTNTFWRDMKSWEDHVYVTAEGSFTGTTDGLLVIDMSMESGSIKWHFITDPIPNANGGETPLGACHNIYIDENGFAYLAGCSVAGGNKAIIYDLNTSKWQPELVSVLGGARQDYAHDLLVRDNIMYSSEIEIGSLVIYDVTDKVNPIVLGETNTSFEWTHNAWISDDANYVFTTDERPNATIDAYDISDLGNIKRLDRFQPSETAGRGVIPHNTHYKDGYLITSWYTDGVVITDVNKPDNMVKVGSYDTYLGPDGELSPDEGFDGCWGVYPWLPSGIVIASDINSGLYIFNPTYTRASYLEGTVTDKADGLAINNVTVEIQAPQINRKTSNSLGQYKTGHANAGSYDVKFSHPEYKSVTLQADIVSGEVTILDAQLEKKQRVTINGVVISEETGSLIQNAKVLFFNSNSELEFTTDSNGAFTTEVFEEDYKVVIGAWGFEHLEINASVDGSTDFEFELPTGYMDDFFFDLGWEVEANINYGNWRKAEINGRSFPGTVFSPDGDVPDDIGDQCYYTSDVDNQYDILSLGNTSLISPTMDLSSYNVPILEFRYFLYNGFGGGTPDDDLDVVLIVNDNEEIPMSSLSGDTDDWSDKQQLDIKDFSGDLENVKVKFFAEEAGTNVDFYVGAIDVFRILEGEPTSSGDIAEDLSITLSPNPFNGETLLSFEDDYNRLDIISVTGELISTQQLLEKDVMIGGELQTGLYFAKLTNNNGQERIVKLIKE